MDRVDAIVVGAGLAGLAAAHRLRALGLDVLVLESASRPGGAVRTVRDRDWLLEQGPHAVDASAPALRALLSEADVDPGLLVPATPSSRERFVVQDGRRRAVPLTPIDLLRSDVLPFSAKLRLLLEPLVRRRVDTDEESVAAFASRRFGPRTLDLVDAVVTGVHAGDPQRLSVRAAFPALVEAERTYGSVLRGIAKGSRRKRTLAAPLGGMERLIEALCERLTVRTATQVTSVEKSPDGSVVTLADATRYTTHHLVLAAPPGPVAEMLGITRPDVPNAPVTVVGLGFRDDDLPADTLRGYGALHPHNEGLFTLGMLHESTLFPAQAPAGHSLVRALVGGRRAADRAHLPDNLLVDGVLDDLERIVGMNARPVWSHVLRNRRGIPQLELCHQAHIEPIVGTVGRMAGVALAGWGWSGIGIENSIASGQEAAKAVLSDA
ncbi:MAG: protoporphyrinogen oxidase [Euryarchaeota archaeon]|nr:protoporphyrinogen oxidase [Euryarchaeota archaeon]